jgi:hypothetical protein
VAATHDNNPVLEKFTQAIKNVKMKNMFTKRQYKNTISSLNNIIIDDE